MDKLKKDLINSNFLACVKQGDLKGAKKFLQQGASLHVTDHDGDSALTHAASKNAVEIVKFLIEEGININHQNDLGETPLIKACFHGHTDIAQILLASNAD